MNTPSPDMQRKLEELDEKLAEGFSRTHRYVTENADAISSQYREHLAVQGEEIIDSDDNEFKLVARFQRSKSDLPIVYTTIEKSQNWMKKARGIVP